MPDTLTNPLRQAQLDHLVKQFPLNDVSEETAFQAFQFIKDAEEPQDQFAKDSLDIMKASLGSYVGRNRSLGLPIFPNETAKLNQKRNDYLKKLYTQQPADFLEAPQLAAYEETLKIAPDPEGYRARSANKAYLDAVAGTSIPDDRYDFVRDQFARQNLGLLEDTSDKAVFHAMKERHDQHDQGTEYVKKTGAEIYKAALEGTDRQTLPGFRKTAEDAGLPAHLLDSTAEQLQSAYRQGQADRRDALPLVKQIVTGFAHTRGRDLNPDQVKDPDAPEIVNAQQAAEAIFSFGPTKRAAILHMVAHELENLPEIQDGDLDKKIILNMINGFRTGGTGLGKFADLLMTPSRVFGSSKEEQEEFEVKTQMKEAMSGLLALPELWEPTDAWHENMLEKALIGGSGQVANMAMVFGGGLGLATLGASMAGDSYSAQRLESPEGNPGIQAATGVTSGVAQAATEVYLTKAGLKLLGGRVPGLAKLFARTGVSNPIARSAIAAPLAVAGAVAVETAEEIAQEATDLALSDLGRELSGLDASTDWGAFLTSWTTHNRKTEEVFYSIVPFALIGAGAVTSFRHFQHGQFLQNAAPVMRQLGFRPDKIEAIQEANPEEAATIVREEMKRVNSRDQAAQASAPASKLAEEGNQRAAVLEAVREAAEVSRRAGFPVLTVETNEFTEEAQYLFTPPNAKQEVFETEEAAAEAYQSWLLDEHAANLDTITRAANEEAIAFLTEEGQLAQGTRVNERDVAMTPERAVKEGLASMEILKARAEIFALQEGSTKPTKDFRIMARRFAEVSTRGVYRGTVEYFRGADPLNLIEDLAETNFDKGLELGLYDGNTLLKQLRQVQQSTGQAYVSDDYTYSETNRLALLEGLSKLAVEYSLGKVRADSFPAKIRQWLEYIVAVAGSMFRHAQTLARSEKLMGKVNEGKIDEDFLSLIADSVGLNDKETTHRREQLMAKQAQAQALDQFDEVSDSLRGKIPHPQTLLDKSHPLHGDLARIHDSMRKVTRRKNKKGEALMDNQKADNYFLPKGEFVDLDKLREELNEEGYDFETPTDMIAALEDSLLYGIQTHAIGNQDAYQHQTGGSFSITSAQDAAYLSAVESGDMETAQGFSPNQIKSADPVTYDESGKVIPLSQRFNEKDERISFSLSAPGVQRLEAAVIAKLNKGPEERIDYASKLIDRLHGLRQKSLLKGQLSDMEKMKENVREAGAIFTALPVEARPAASFPIGSIMDAKGERARITLFEKMIDSADRSLEIYLKKQYLETLTKLFDLAKPDLRQNKSLRTRLSAPSQRLASQAYAASVMSPDDVMVELAAVDTVILKLEAKRLQAAQDNEAETVKETSAQLHDAERHKRMLDTFGALAFQSSPELAHALDNLRHIYSQGRFEREVIDDQRRQELDEWRASILSDLGGKPADDAWARRTANEGLKDTMAAFRMGSMSFHQIMEEFFPNSQAARQFQKRTRIADRDVTRARISARERFEDHLRERWNKGKLGQSKILAKLSERQELPIKVRGWKSKIKEKLTPEQAKGILDGTITVEWSADPIALASLRQALADFNLKRLQDQSRAEFVRFSRVKARANATPLVISPLETVYVLQLAGQEQYLPALDRYGYTEGVLNSLRKNLPDEARDIADFLAHEYAGEYDRLNPVYRELFHMDMPRVKNYAPGSFEHAMHTSTPDPDGTEGAQVNALSAGFTKSREHHTARPQQRNALDVFWNHQEQTEYFIAWASIVRDLGAVFKTPDVRRAMEAKHGRKVASNFFNWLDILATDAKNQSTDETATRHFINNAQSSLSAIGLAFNVGSLLKQVSAGTGALMEMPTNAAISGIYQAIANPASFKHLWNNEIIQQRIRQGMSPEDRAILDAANAKPSVIMSILEAGRAPLGWTDGLFTTLSAMVAYNYHHAEALKAGLSPEKAEAHAIAIMDRVVTRTAQPATAQDKSLIENTSKGFTKFLLIFRSDPRQKMALAMEAVNQYQKGKISGLELGRKFFWGWAMYGILAQIATDVWHAMSREDDDDDWKLDDYIFSALAGPLSGLPLFGGILETGMRAAINAVGGDVQIFKNSTNPLDKAAYDMIKGRTWKVISDDVDNTASEVLQAILSDSRAWSQVLGVFHKSAAVVPVAARVLKDSFGIIDNMLPDSPEERHRAILDEFLQEGSEARETTTLRKEALIDELEDLPANEQKERLAELDKTLARSIAKSLSDKSLTRNEKKLRSIPTKDRHRAISAILETLSPDKRAPYLQRLREIKILTPKIEQQL